MVYASGDAKVADMEEISPRGYNKSYRADVAWKKKGRGIFIHIRYGNFGDVALGVGLLGWVGVVGGEFGCTRWTFKGQGAKD